MKLGACVCQRPKRKLKEKTKELHACLLSNLGLVFIQEHTLKQNREKKRSHPGSFSISSVMNGTEEKGGGEN